MGSRGRIALALLLLVAGFGALHFPPPHSESIFGSVHDSDGPVPGAIVRFKGGPFATRTDTRGRFRLPAAIETGATITAAKEGYFITGGRPGRLPPSLSLRHLPTVDCEAYRWVDPAPDPKSKPNCANCHAEIYREWSASGHANSVRNRHFHNLFDGSDWHGRRNVGWSLLADHPDGAGVCTACHAPTIAFNDPAYFDPRQVSGVDACGVHCDYCHKITDAPTENLGLTHGRFGLSLLRPSEGQLSLGPLDDVDRGEDSYSPLYRESRYCASCHEGTVFGIHVYGTYTEWLASPARREGKQCQSCHMAPTGKMTNFAPGHGGIERNPQTLASHRVEGANAALLKGCLKVSLETRRDNEAVRAQVAVRADDVGHRVPTGFVDRNLVLIVEPLGNDRRRLAALIGPTLPAVAGKDFAGLPGRLYAKLLQNSNGQTPAPFWQTPSAVMDSRLLPGQTDVAEFRFPGAVTQIRIRLLYRRFWPEVAEIKRWPNNEITVMDTVVRLPADRSVRWASR